MRVFITSIPEELERHQAAACDVAREFGFDPVLRDRAAGGGVDTVRACARQVAAADLVLAIVGWRRGPVPPPELGGDGLHPWSWWEIRSAFDQRKPVVVLMADEAWRSDLREDAPRGRALVQDFRGELGRLASLFDDEPADASPPLAGFRELVQRELTRHRPGAPADYESASEEGLPADLRLRSRQPPELPKRPYPLLLPYKHPEMMAGRGREIAELRRALTLQVPIVGFFAPAGTGKSSVLAAGLVPLLRDEGRPVAFDRHPSEPVLAGRLLRDLLEADDERALEVNDDDHGRFVAFLLAARRLGGTPPVLVLDQFEDLLRRPGERRARALVGMLLAASVQRQPGCGGPLCHWLLAYRQEFHGEVVEWLGDALREARSLGLTVAETLPHELAGAERFHTRTLAPLGTPPPGCTDPLAEATRVFLAAIETPLALRTNDGKARYPWRFAEDGAARLARAFGEARVAQPRAPLVPELQVVLAHLLAQAPAPDEEGQTVVPVPEEPGGMIAQALEEHLRRALVDAFPGRGEAARLGRTRALLALRELADARGGLLAEELVRAIGRQGREVLEKLATPRTRIVVPEQQGDEWVYVLAHDRMAEVVVRLVDEEGGHPGLGVDAELLRLRRLVALKSELFAAGEVEQATAVPARSFRRIADHGPVLLWGEDRERWWAACRDRRRRDRQRTSVQWGLGALIALAVVLGVGFWISRGVERRALLAQVAEGEPKAVFKALDELVEWAPTPEELRQQLRQRAEPLDVLERGIPAGENREEAVLRAAELALPLIDEAPEDTVRIASLVWALDTFASQERAQKLRDRALLGLRQTHPPPAFPKPYDSDWADIPAGTFRMDSVPREGRDDEDMSDQRPKLPITISAFRIMTHEVTNGEYRRLFPKYEEKEEKLPATDMSWHEAYTYAAWLGGRLPTEAEWNYAARAGCIHRYCKSDGTEADLDEVAWWIGNATDESGLPAPRVVMQLQPNPWGLFDVYGNVWEMTANWHGGAAGKHLVAPSTPGDSAHQLRLVLGGSMRNDRREMFAFQRGRMVNGQVNDSIGIRVVVIGAFP